MTTIITRILLVCLGLQYCVDAAFFKKDTPAAKPFVRATMNLFSDFEDLTKCTTFVDKTLLMSQFFNVSGSRQFHLLTCPHKFGKTTNLNMMRRFLRESSKQETILNRQLFQNTSKNLKISPHVQNGTALYEHFQGYAVIQVSFKFDQATNLEDTMLGVRKILKALYQRLPMLLTGWDPLWEKHYSLRSGVLHGKLEWVSEDDIAYGFLAFSKMVSHFLSDRKIFWLIDDYDYPILKAIENNFEVIRITQFIRKIFKQLFSSHQTSVNYAFITGTLNVLDEIDSSTITHSNFLDNHPFVEYFGFTEDEVEHMFKQHGISDTEKTLVKQHYNPYAVLNSPIRIYNPYSIVNYLNKRNPQNPQEMLLNYWTKGDRISSFLRCSQGNPKYQKIIHNLLELKQVTFNLKKRWSLDDLDKMKNIAHNGTCDLTTRRIDLVLSYLFHNGYLSHGDSPQTYSLPNDEIKTSLDQAGINEDKSLPVNVNDLKSRLSPKS